MLHNGVPIDPIIVHIPCTVHVPKLPNDHGPPTSCGTKKVDVNTPKLPNISTMPNANNKRCMTGNRRCRCDDEIIRRFIDVDDVDVDVDVDDLDLALFSRNRFNDKYIMADEPMIERRDDIQPNAAIVAYCVIFHDCVDMILYFTSFV